MPSDRTRDEEVERLMDLGAILIGDHRKADGTGWVVLATGATKRVRYRTVGLWARTAAAAAA